MKWILGVAILLAVSGIVLAQQGPQQGRMWRDRDDIAGQLNLTQEQRTKFDNLRSEHHKSMVRKQADLRIAQIDLDNLMDADQPDKNRIAGKLKDISDLQHSQKMEWLEHMFGVRALLTQEQLEIWKDRHRGYETGGLRHNRHQGYRGGSEESQW